MTVDSRSDGDLIEACNHAGPEAAANAFGALYRRHRSYVLRVARRFTDDHDVAADVLQETFIYLLRQFPPTGKGLKLTARLTTFLYPIAKNFAISALRKAERFEAAAEAPEDLPDPAPASADHDAIERALAHLSSERREVLILRFVDDMTLKEIAAVLQIPLGTVKSRLHFALGALRENPKIKDLFEP